MTQPIPIFFFIKSNGTDTINPIFAWLIIAILAIICIALICWVIYFIYTDEINDFLFDCKIFFKDLFKGMKY